MLWQVSPPNSSGASSRLGGSRFQLARGSRGHAAGPGGRSLPPRGLPGGRSPSPEMRGPPPRRAAPATCAQSPRGRRSRHGRGSGSCGDAPGRGYRRLLLQRHSGLGSSAPVRKLPPEPRLMTNLSQKLSPLLALPGGLSH